MKNRKPTKQEIELENKKEQQLISLEEQRAIEEDKEIAAEDIFYVNEFD